MHILQVFDYISLSPGGGTVHVIYRLSRALSEKGHQVEIYAGDIGLDDEYIKSIPEVKVRPFKRWLNVAGMQFMQGMMSTVKKELGNFDIIHLHCVRSFQNIIIHHYAVKYAVPYVIDSHGSLPRSHGRLSPKWLMKWLYDICFGNRLLRDTSMVIAETAAGVDEYERFGVKREKCAIVPPPFPTGDFSELPHPGLFREKYNLADKKIILFMGRINWIKGIDFLVESFGKISANGQGMVLIIAGDDDGYKKNLQRQISKLGITDRVIFTGFLSGAEKLSALVDADVLVQASVYEQGTGVPFEAAMCGTPVIVSRDTIASENISGIDGGYLVDYGNTDELAATIKYVFEHADEAAEKTLRMKRYISENLSLDKAIEKYEQVYARCIDDNQNNKHNSHKLEKEYSDNRL